MQVGRGRREPGRGERAFSAFLCILCMHTLTALGWVACLTGGKEPAGALLSPGRTYLTLLVPALLVCLDHWHHFRADWGGRDGRV